MPPCFCESSTMGLTIYSDVRHSEPMPPKASANGIWESVAMDKKKKKKKKKKNTALKPVS
eukprot:NODE_9771_length_1400_cov_8.974077.p10 GENE.NODE_9771_length_1400_cov_8.974077~~NODE_9771_length_1400_cov_8.974077.p10  ORF type:complete len:60 (-),score=22.86 NODE_9771_length_1400_cov_8.974077:82-261(-)